MCLPQKVHAPDTILHEAKHKGYELAVTHNGMGYRCGYVKLEPGHPWHSAEFCSENSPLNDVLAHGGITFSQPDVECDLIGDDNGWWIGFDCAHAGDAMDHSLPMSASQREFQEQFSKICDFRSALDYEIRTLDYVINQCESVIDQAIAAADPALMSA